MDRVLTPQSRCRFGIARADITPPVGIYHRMWGAATHDRSEGVHRPLTATALWFSPLGPGDATQQQVLIAIDHCLLGVQEVTMILDRVVAVSGIDRSAIVLTFAHTHAAGLLNLDRRELPGGEMIADYLDRLATRTAGLVAAAAESAVAADIVYGSGRCGLAAHRDYFDVQAHEFVCGYNPAGPADDALLLARVTDADHRLLATVVNYACHPTSLAWDNRLISPDYPGAMRELMERATGAICVFLQGASGDLGPVEGFVGDPEIADRNGRQLAYAALSTYESLPPANTSFEYAGKVVSGASIGTWRRAAITNRRAEQLAAWSCCRPTWPLAYRDDLPKSADVAAQHQALLAEESAARQQGDLATARQLRALAERQARMLARLQTLPAGDAFPYPASIWRMGDAVWIAVPGEPYSQLQQALRRSFPDHPIVVATLANGWGPSYLPPRELYGRGIYQESIAALAPGCLEKLIESLQSRIKTLLTY